MNLEEQSEQAYSLIKKQLDELESIYNSYAPNEALDRAERWYVRTLSILKGIVTKAEVERFGEFTPNMNMFDDEHMEAAYQEYKAKLNVLLDEVKDYPADTLLIAQKKAELPKENKQPSKRNIVYGNRWELVKSIGEGGQAHTFLVKDLHDNEKLFALKRLKNLKRLQRFEKEVEALKEIDHPNVIKLIDSDFKGERPYLVSEFCSDGSLDDLDLAAIPTFTRLKLFEGVCHGLVAAHSLNIVHRDIKPANILLKNSGRSPIVADFGLCFKDENGERHTLVEEAVGARFFMAPELEDGRAEDIKPASDVYSLGKLLYWFLSGGRSFSREKHREAGFDLVTITKDPQAEHFNLLLDKMIIQDPLKRIQNASLLRDEFSAICKIYSRGFNAISPRDPRTCRYCGKGSYKLRAEGGTQIHNFGFSSVSGSTLKVFGCDHCGNVQIFQLESGKLKEWWKSNEG